MAESSVRDILVLVAHPDLGRSMATRSLLAALRASPAAARVEVRDLYGLYPDFHIHHEAEQRALAGARLVVMLHPIYWYSMPALQKLWLADVLQLGWAFGPGGTALQGKDFWLVASTGGAPEAFATAELPQHPVEDYLLPYRQCVLTCGMRWLPPLILQHSHRASAAQIAAHGELFLQRLEHYPAGDSAPADAGGRR